MAAIAASLNALRAIERHGGVQILDQLLPVSPHWPALTASIPGRFWA